MDAAIYTRISLDRDGDSFSPERQEALCRQLAASRGWTVRRVYTDRDLSGWKDVRRPEFEAMMKAVDRGDVKAVVAYSLVRLGRRATKLGEFLERLTERGVTLALVDMNIDTASPAGELMFTVVAGLAQLESKQISDRVKSFETVAAQRGRIHSGGMRHYGYQRDGAVVPEEAEVIREAAQRLAAGEGLRGVATDLNRRGLLSTTGRQWYTGNLRKMVLSPRLVGVRTHNGDRTPGTWEPILAEADQEDVRAALALRQSRAMGAATTRHLLTGLAVCGRCGKPMQASKARSQYRCFSAPGREACGAVVVSMERLEEHAARGLLDWVAGAHMRMGGEAGALADLERLAEEDAAALGRLNRMCFVERTLSEAEWRPMRDEIVTRLDETKANLARLRVQVAEQAGALPPGDREALQAWWDGAAFEDRRAALRASLTGVVVRPKGPAGHRFDPARVELQWRLPFVLEGGRQRWESMTDEERAAGWERLAAEDGD